MSTLINKHSRGAMIVDAACCLPIFIIAMSIILMLIAQAGIEDTVSFAMSEASDDAVLAIAGTGRSVSDNSGADGQSASIAGDAVAFAAFDLGLKDTLSEEWKGDSPRVRLAWLHTDLEYCLDGGINLDNLISANVGVGTALPFGTFLGGMRYSGRDMLFRPWVGESRQSEAYDDTRVYVFPKRGEHYHCSACSCLRNGDIQVVLTEKIRKKYNACPTCRAGALPDGSAVFLMSVGSSAFHRRTCPCITKAYECVSLTEAKSMGLSPCGLCGGTPENYSPYTDYFR